MGKYYKYIRDKEFWESMATSLVLLGVSLIVNFYAITYATEQASNSVTDIILSSFPALDVDSLFLYTTLFAILVTAVVLLSKPQTLPFAIKSLGLFIIVRSSFVILTHVGPFPTETTQITSPWLKILLFDGDRFFSGHTGMPFLGALVFWDRKILRYFYLGTSVFFGAVVLAGHLHYSIDVLSAFFITYTIYHLSAMWFKKDLIMFKSGQVHKR